jgi:hypothetical protein
MAPSAPEDQQSRRRKRELEMTQRGRAKIAEELGHEVDSDGEREYYNARWAEMNAAFLAEDARRNALSPEERRQEDIKQQADEFKKHIKPILSLDFAGHLVVDGYLLFLLQLAPHSHNGATCRLRLCTDCILPGQYRVAVSPGVAHYPGEMLLSPYTGCHFMSLNHNFRIMLHWCPILRDPQEALGIHAVNGSW